VISKTPYSHLLLTAFTQCLGTQEERIVTSPLTFLAKAKKRCGIPFMYQKKTHYSCIKLESEEIFKCPLYVHPDTNELQKDIWGQCDESCPGLEDAIEKNPEDSWEPWYIIVLVLGILFVSSIVIIYHFYNKRKKSFSRKKSHGLLNTMMDGNLDMINN
jgi:hypothetical protein